MFFKEKAKFKNGLNRAFQSLKITMKFEFYRQTKRE